MEWSIFAYTIVIWLSGLSLSKASQRTVNMLNPCNKGQSYSLTKGDVLYIDIEQGWFKDSCDAMVEAGLGCRSICIEIISEDFRTCRVSTAIYDTDTWDVKPSNLLSSREKSGCSSTKIYGPDTVCTKSRAAVIRVSSKEWARDMGHQYKSHFMVRPDCSPLESLVDGSGDFVLLSWGKLVGIVAGFVTAAVIVTTAVFVLLYLFVVKRRSNQQPAVREESQELRGDKASC